MVNVGGRSKGCSTCRRRRVKCDENSPVCLRCQRAGLECSGPKVEMSFVEANIVTSRRKVKSPRETFQPAPDVPQIVVSSRSPIIHPSAPLLNPQELYITFTQGYLEQGGPIGLALHELQSQDITQLQTTSSIADCRTSHLQTVLSFATIFFGTRQKLPDVTQQGYLVHGTTLQQLNRALSVPNCYMYDEIIVAVTTLAVQESLVPTGPTLFMKHMLGLERLLALRDPSVAYSPRTVSLYKCLRHMLLIAALISGTPTILAKSNWKAMFRRYCKNEEEVQEQQLYDILADCSVERSRLIEEQNAGHEDFQIRTNDMVQRAQGLRERALSWRAEWDANSTNSYIQLPTPLTDIVFPNIAAARKIMLYNITLLYVLSTLKSHLHESRPENSREEYRAATHSAVLELCRSMPGPSNGNSHTEMHASPVFHWAIQTANMALRDDDSVEGKWLVELMNQKSAQFFAK
ncbi:hypothetical protein GQ44DRAFT_640507 [Phaeosphaeriaceae sp. PMI808]|nr:hypothetical protein GQ44DRAFT_640507 [Phaeosphaeriaceae sp. PMI808]